MQGDLIERPIERGVDHRAGVRYLHARANTVGSTAPARVHQPDVRVMHYDLLAEQFGVDVRRLRQEWGTETSAEIRLWFGDPALGAQGNTATGRGSLGIRDSLSAAGQRGFNAAVNLHLSRKYERTSATITATPNPVIVPKGQASGSVTISWIVPQGYTYCEIYLSVDNGQWSEFARGGDGTKPTTIKPGSSQTFRMMVYEGQAGTPRVITILTVTAKN